MREFQLKASKQRLKKEAERKLRLASRGRRQAGVTAGATCDAAGDTSSDDDDDDEAEERDEEGDDRAGEEAGVGAEGVGVGQAAAGAAGQLQEQVDGAEPASGAAAEGHAAAVAQRTYLTPEPKALSRLVGLARKHYPGRISTASDGATFILEKHEGVEDVPEVADFEGLREEKRQTDCKVLMLDPELAEKKKRQAADRQAEMHNRMKTARRRPGGPGGGGGGGGAWRQQRAGGGAALVAK